MSLAFAELSLHVLSRLRVLQPAQVPARLCFCSDDPAFCFSVSACAFWFCCFQTHVGAHGHKKPTLHSFIFDPTFSSRNYRTVDLRYKVLRYDSSGLLF